MSNIDKGVEKLGQGITQLLNGTPDEVLGQLAALQRGWAGFHTPLASALVSASATAVAQLIALGCPPNVAVEYVGLAAFVMVPAMQGVTGPHNLLFRPGEAPEDRCPDCGGVLEPDHAHTGAPPRTQAELRFVPDDEPPKAG